jgi:hypothetical protein
MPLTIDQIRQASHRTTIAKSFRNISEAKLAGTQTAFLCHSHKDEDLVQGIINLLKESGWNIYVDWADSAMPETPNIETAKKIKDKILENNYFLFLATENSVVSRWCPWEIGFADGKKENIFIIPTSHGMITYGNEYLSLYKRIDISSSGTLAAWLPGISNGKFLKNF